MFDVFSLLLMGEDQDDDIRLGIAGPIQFAVCLYLSIAGATSEC